MSASTISKSLLDARFKKLRSEIALALGGLVGPFARAWNEAQQNVAASATPTIIVSESITPLSTGRIRVVVTGSGVGAGDGGPTTFTLSLSTGAGPTPAIYTAGGPFTSQENAIDAAIALSVDLDKAAALTFPVGTPVTIHAVLTVLGANLPARANLQITLQEVAA